MLSEDQKKTSKTVPGHDFSLNFTANPYFYHYDVIIIYVQFAYIMYVLSILCYYDVMILH